jgi:hypothetical protein
MRIISLSRAASLVGGEAKKATLGACLMRQRAAHLKAADEEDSRTDLTGGAGQPNLRPHHSLLRLLYLHAATGTSYQQLGQSRSTTNGAAHNETFDATIAARAVFLNLI